MKNIVFLGLLLIVMAFGFTNCDNNGSDDNNENLTVTFDLNGGNVNGNTSSISRVVKYGEVISPVLIPQPIKQNHYLSGWITGAGNSFDKNTQIKSNLTVYANWIQEFIVTFDLNGGNVNGNTSSISRVVISGETISYLLFPNPVKQDNYLIGWITVSGNIFDENTQVISNLTVYANWTDSIYSSIFGTWFRDIGSIPYQTTDVISLNNFRRDDTVGDFHEININTWEFVENSHNETKVEFPIGFKLSGTVIANRAYINTGIIFIFLNNNKNKYITTFGEDNINNLKGDNFFTKQ